MDGSRTNKHQMIHSSYLHKLFSPTRLTAAIERAKTKLNKLEFEGIAVRGNSGTIFGGALAYVLDKRLILVRKNDEENHSYLSVEGDDKIQKYLFVDDIIDTGKTFLAVKSTIEKKWPNMECVGAYEYSRPGGHAVLTVGLPAIRTRYGQYTI